VLFLFCISKFRTESDRIPHDSVRVAGLVPGVGFSPIECIVLYCIDNNNNCIDTHLDMFDSDEDVGGGLFEDGDNDENECLRLMWN